MATKQEQWPGGLWDEEPGTFDTLETWERYLKMVETMDFAPDAIPSKVSLMRRARETIAWKKREEGRAKARQAKRA